MMKNASKANTPEPQSHSLIQTAALNNKSWPCSLKFLNDFEFLDAHDGSVSLALSHHCLPASRLIHFNLPSLAQKTRDTIPASKAASGTNWILMANLDWKPLMRWFLNLPAWNNDDRHSTKQENIRMELQVCIRTGTGHKHTETRGVMQREMKYSAGFWWRLLNQSQRCHSNLKTSTRGSPPPRNLWRVYPSFAWGTLELRFFNAVHSDSFGRSSFPFSAVGK